MQTIDKSVALSKGLLPCCIFMSCLGKSEVIFNQSHRKGWRARGDPPLPQPQKTPPPATTGKPASPHLAVNNMHHSLDLVHICLHAAGSGRCVSLCVCVLVYQCEDLFQGALDKWRCHMVRPDVLVSYVHSSSKTTTGATIGPLLSGKASQPICFLPARPSAFWVWLFLSCIFSFQPVLYLMRAGVSALLH